MTEPLGIGEPTEKQRKFVENYKKFNFNPQFRSQALRLAGYSASSSKSGSSIERSCKPFIIRALKNMGVTPKRLAGKLSELLDCPMEPTVQLRALDMGLRLMSAYPDTKIKTSTDERTVRTDIDTLRMAEEVTGETFIELLPEHKANPDDNLAPI